MDLKKAKALVESREKLNPDYAKAVKMCIENDKTTGIMQLETKVKTEKPKLKAKTEVKKCPKNTSSLS